MPCITWIDYVELALLFLTAILAVPQLFFIKKQMKDNHEERRRENTINFMSTWCNSVKKDTSIAEQVARKLNCEQCKKLYKHEPFAVSDDIKKDVCKFCPLDTEKCENCTLKDSNTIDGKILTELRWHVITYLNTLETLMVSWHLGIVDKKTIEEQFAFMNDSEKGCTLAEFRHSAGGYPLIEEFIDEIKKSSSTPKKPL